MSKLSSDELFHFTRNLECLKSILKNGFFPHVVKEDLSFIYTEIPQQEATKALAMISFCDIPIELQEQHCSTYGRYGLAMTKEWGLRNGVCPVAYIPTNNNTGTLIDSIGYIASQIKGLIRIDNEEMYAEIRQYRLCETHGYIEELYGEIIQLFGYFKKYEEIDCNNNDKRFYDEKEWRYLCPWTLAGELLYKNRFEFSTKDMNDEEIEQYNEKLQEKPLKFRKDDLIYAVVPNEKDKKELIEYLHTIKQLGGNQLNESINCLTINVRDYKHKKGDAHNDL